MSSDLSTSRIRPNKGLGQYFLTDKAVLRKIIDTADVQPKDIILEIGPGTGILTLELAKRAKKVIAVEKDHKMCEILKERLNNLGIKNVEIVQGDILKIDPKTYNLKLYKIVANLPYYITSPVIRKFLETKNPAKEMILMVQKEVAQRICAKPPDMSILAVSVQFYAKPEIISYVSKRSFWPQPKVDSAIIKITPTKNWPRTGLRHFFEIVKAGFSHPRKQLINNLSTELSLNREQINSWLQNNKIRPDQRAETLEVKDWINLESSFGLTTKVVI